MTVIERIKGIFAARKTEPSHPGDKTFYYYPKKRGGVYVSHEKALELSACFGCCRTISEDIAKMPWNVFAKEGNQKVRLDGSAIHLLLNTRPNPNMTSFTFRETLMMWTLTWGNGYAEIERNMSGRPIALWPISPDRVEPRRDADGTVYYEVDNQRQGGSIINQRDMFHVHGPGWDGLMGYSMIGLAATTLGFGIATEEHGANYFGNNTIIGLALKTDMALGDQAYQRLKEEIESRRGSARAYEGMILEQGLDFAYPSQNTTQSDSQFVETRRQLIEDICRWWRVPPHKVAELSRAHFANVENLNIDYVTDALMPWVKRLEEEADWKLIGPRSQAAYTKFATKELMRGDSQAMAAWYREMRHMGVMNVNEIREELDLDPIGPNGDMYTMQMQYVSLDYIREQEPPNVESSEPEDDEEDPMEVAARGVAARLFTAEFNKAKSAVMRYPDRQEFVVWMDKQNEKAKSRQMSEMSGLLKLMKLGDEPERLVDAYLAEERKQLLSFFDGDNPDYDKLTAAIMEAV